MLLCYTSLDSRRVSPTEDHKVSLALTLGDEAVSSTRGEEVIFKYGHANLHLLPCYHWGSFQTGRSKQHAPFSHSSCKYLRNIRAGLLCADQGGARYFLSSRSPSNWGLGATVWQRHARETPHLSEKATANEENTLRPTPEFHILCLRYDSGATDSMTPRLLVMFLEQRTPLRRFSVHAVDTQRLTRREAIRSEVCVTGASQRRRSLWKLKVIPPALGRG